MKISGGGRTFVVRVLDMQNSTWQGTVTWTDSGKQEQFRSALELIRLIDSTLELESGIDIAGKDA